MINLEETNVRGTVLAPNTQELYVGKSGTVTFYYTICPDNFNNTMYVIKKGHKYLSWTITKEDLDSNDNIDERLFACSGLLAFRKKSDADQFWTLIKNNDEYDVTLLDYATLLTQVSKPIVFTVENFIDLEPEEKPECKIFLSQPMSGLSLDDIKKTRDHYKKILQSQYTDCKVTIINNLQEDMPEGSHPLAYMSNDIRMMIDADLVVFVPGYSEARGCRVEEFVAKSYDKIIQYL